MLQPRYFSAHLEVPLARCLLQEQGGGLRHAKGQDHLVGVNVVICLQEQVGSRGRESTEGGKKAALATASIACTPSMWLQHAAPSTAVKAPMTSNRASCSTVPLLCLTPTGIVS